MELGASFEFGGTDRFEIRRRIGSGGMGIVYEAFDREQRRVVALKTLRNVAPKAIFRFKQEFRALQDIAHPNLVSLGDLIEVEGEWFFTMELVEGVDFLSYVRPRAQVPPLPSAPEIGQSEDTLRSAAVLDGASASVAPLHESRLRAVLSQLASALVALHDAGKIHRDIKPTNILVTPEGRAVLLDFGLVTEAGGVRQSTEAHVVGTAAYMAPEQGAAEKVGPAADWYSVGIILYEALTGRVPFSGSTYKIILDKQLTPPPPPRASWPEVPADLDALCLDLLQTEPDARPTGASVLQRLGAASSPLTQPAALSASSTFTQGVVFVGRDDELAALHRAFDDSRRNDAPVSVFVHGDSGVGKTELIRQFADLITDEHNDTVVLAGRCYERESVPFKALDGVVDALSRYLRRIPEIDAATLVPRNASLLARVFPVLRRVEAISAASVLQRLVSDPHELRSRAFAALRDLFSLLGERHPLILIIDDFQWSDADSLLLLGSLLRPPMAPRLLLLASTRAAAPHGAAAGRGEWSRADEALVPGDERHLELGPLDPDVAHRLAHSLLERLGEAAVANAAAIAMEALGHPLYINELARYAAFADATRPGPLRLNGVIWQRAAQLPPAARHVLELVCVATAPLPRAVIGQAARAELGDLARYAALLRVAHLVLSSGQRDTDAMEPYHNRVQEAVLMHLDADTRREHHDRLALALTSTGLAAERPQLLVHHLEAAGKTHKAAACAEESAQRAVQALAFDRAADLFRTALRLGDYQGEARLGIRIALGDALANTGRCAEAATVYTEAAASADPAARLDCQRKAAQQFLIGGHIENGLNLLNSVLGDIGVSLARSPRRALASLLVQRLRLRLRGTGWRDMHPSQLAPEVLKRLDILNVVATGLGVVDTVRAMDFHARALRLALETGERSRIAVGLSYEAMFVASRGVVGEARAQFLMKEARRAAGDRPDPYVRAWLQSGRAFITYFGGEFHQAAKEYARAEAQFRDQTVGSVWELNQVRLFRLHGLRLSGRFAQLKKLQDDYVRDAVQRGDRYMETTLRRANALLCLAADQPQKTLDELARAAWMAPDKTFHLQHWYELEARAQLALYDGTVVAAVEALAPSFVALQRALLLRIQIVRATATWLRARLELAVAESDEADHGSALRRAARHARALARERIGYATAWSLLITAAIAAQRGRDALAVSELRAAIDAATAHSLASVAGAARYRLGQLIGGDEGAELVAKADAWMSAAGIARPERMLEVLAPGFTAPGTPTGGGS